MKNIFISIVVLVCLLGNAFAKNNTIVITSNRIGEPEKEITQNITVYDEEELQTYAGATLGDFLKNINTSHIHKYPGASVAVSERGFRTDTHGSDLRGHVLILVNGRRAGSGNAALIPMTNIERIEIIRGPSAIQYGSAAIGGVINIITKKGGGKPELFLEYEAGSFNHKGYTFGGSGEYKGLDFSFAVKDAKTDSYDTTKGKYPETDTEENSISLNIGYTYKFNRIGFIYNVFDTGDIGYNNKFDYTIANKDLYTDNSQKKKLKSYDLVYSGQTENLKWNLKFFKGKDEKTYKDRDQDDYWGSASENYYETKFKGYQGNFITDNKLWEMSLGFDYNNYEIKNRNSDNIAPFSPDSEYSDLGIFINPKLKFMNEKLILSAGIRYDEYNLEIKETPLRTVLPKDKNIYNTTYSAGVRYNLTKNFSFKANYGEAFVIPQADQLNADYSVWGTPYKGNPYLDPEKSKTYEMGIDYKNAAMSGYLTLFKTDYTDKIITKSYGTYYSWVNAGESVFKGAEFGFKYDIGSLINSKFVIEPYFDFTYFDTFKDKENDEKMLYVSRFQGSYGIFVANDPQDFYARLNITFTGKQTIDDYDPFTYSTERKVKDAFSVGNFTIKKRVYNSKRYGSIHLKGEIDNLFNETYSYVEGYLMPERNYKVSAKYVYKF